LVRICFAMKEKEKEEEKEEKKPRISLQSR
jgi:hypothetical protein